MEAPQPRSRTQSESSSGVSRGPHCRLLPCASCAAGTPARADPAIGPALARDFQVQAQRAGHADVLNETRGRVPGTDALAQGPSADDDIGVRGLAILLPPSAPV